ncbi:hypothetical protein [Gilvibacter sediminis]|uniref:hypothetical protein n=1 Tax=Gilvibacter sediminis TaxID=379071 RepID=UPI00235085F4|nr:hypothetical protein [Gilvibacter sediminis]MDC7998934.1 hypothetical protein [Gilvibacter sediminis]
MNNLLMPSNQSVSISTLKDKSKRLWLMLKKQMPVVFGLTAFGLLLNASAATGGLFMTELVTVGFILSCVMIIAQTERQAFRAELRAINKNSRK